jgi:hypothetical protein
MGSIRTSDRSKGARPEIGVVGRRSRFYISSGL